MPDNGIFRRPIRNTATGTGGGGQQSSVGFGIGRKKARALLGNQGGVVVGWLLVVSFFLFVVRQIGMCADKKRKKEDSTGGANRPARAAQIGKTSRLFGGGVSFGGLLTDWGVMGTEVTAAGEKECGVPGPVKKREKWQHGKHTTRSLVSTKQHPR